MSAELTAVIEPFVQRGLFPNAEMAVVEIARDYVLAKSNVTVPSKRPLKCVMA